MTEVLWVVIGILIGGALLGMGVFFYILFTALKNVTSEIRRLNETVAPIFSDQDILRGFKSLQILNAQAEQIGRKIESLDTTMQTFSQIIMKPAAPTYTPAQVAAAASAAAGAGATTPPQENSPGEAYGYSEEEQASREESRKHSRMVDEKSAPTRSSKTLDARQFGSTKSAS